MKHNGYTLWAALLMPLLAACQQDETGLTAATDPNAVVVEASLAAHQTRLDYGSDLNAAWAEGDRIAVNGGLTQATVVYTYDGAAWTSGNYDYLAWADGANSFTAWRPADAATFSTFCLPTAQNTATFPDAADWMTATASFESMPDDRKLSLKFTHRLALVTVEITGSFTTLANVSFALPGQMGEGITADGTAVTPRQDGSTLHAILPTGTYAAGADFLSLQVDGEAVTVSAPAMLTSDGLKAGKHYTFSLRAGKEALTVSNVTVREWTNQSLPDGAPGEVVYVETDAANHTITLLQAGKLRESHLTKALGEGNSLTISGPMNTNDWLTLRTWVGKNQDKSLTLDLENVTELTTIPSPGDSYDINEANNFTGVTTLVLPGSVTTIGYSAFNENMTLTTVTLPNSLRTIDNQAFYCSGLTAIIVPDGVTNVSMYAFTNCESLTQVEWKSDAAIPNGAFESCYALSSVTISGNVPNIGTGAFGYCTVLESITLTSTEAPTLTFGWDWTFVECRSLAHVYVPAEAIDAYTAAGWQYVEADPLEGQH